MKIKIIEIKHNEKIVHKKKYVNVGDVIDIPKDRAEHFISVGNAEFIEESLKKIKIESKV